MLCPLRVTNSENLSHSPSLASVRSDLSWPELTCRRMAIGRGACWRGANADLPLDPGLGKSLGFTLAADSQEGICCARLTTIQSLLVLPTSDRIGRPQAGVLFRELGSVTQKLIP